jgi:HTH-type transcriptional regulator / antitoxin HipB
VNAIVVRQPLILGHAIKAARKSLGLTQAELADAVGTYPRAIIDIERGRQSADMKLVLDVLACVGLQMSVAPL